VIHFLGEQNDIYHAHMKDTVIFKDTARLPKLESSISPPTRPNSRKAR